MVTDIIIHVTKYYEACGEEPHYQTCLLNSTLRIFIWLTNYNAQNGALMDPMCNDHDEFTVIGHEC